MNLSFPHRNAQRTRRTNAVMVWGGVSLYFFLNPFFGRQRCLRLTGSAALRPPLPPCVLLLALAPLLAGLGKAKANAAIAKSRPEAIAMSGAAEAGVVDPATATQHAGGAVSRAFRVCHLIR